MIYTIALTPSLDRVIEVEGLMYDDVNSIREVRKHAGREVLMFPESLRTLADRVSRLVLSVDMKVWNLSVGS